MKRTSLIILILCSLLSAAAQTFKTQAPSSVAQDETFRVQYVLSTSDGEDFHCPSNANFEILGGPSTSTYSSFQIVNGKRSSSSSITYTYILRARRTGKLALPRPTVKVEGRTLQATALSITVTTGSGSSGQSSSYQTPRTADDDDTQYDLRSAKAVTKSDLYVRCISSKSSLYEQEPVVLTYKVYARAGVGLTNIVPRRKPEMKGFWTQEVELPNNLKPSYERIGGSTYRVFTFMQYVAFPQQSGTLTLPPLLTECSVVQRDPNIDALEAFFNGGGSLTTQLQRQSETVQFSVKSLPTPRPANFSGGVGTLQAEGRLLTTQPATNDIATYRITISGQGNMRLIQAPTLTLPKSFDAYDPKTTDETRITYEGIAGKITFDYTFVPREEGDFELPATDFVYFDIQSQSYRTIHLPATPLHVRKGARSREDVERELALRQSNIRPDHLAPQRASRYGWVGYGLTLLLLLLLTLAADRLMGASLSDRLRSKWRSSTHQQNKHLAAASQALAQGDARALYAALEQAFSAAGVDSDAAQDILSRRYAPDASEPSNLQQTMDAARRLLPLLLLFLLPCMSMVAAETAQPDTTAQTAALCPADSAYNAGNEAYRLKEYGQAVLCYSRALWLDADHEDARYNLSLVQTRLEDQFSVPQEMFFTTWTRSLRTAHSVATWLRWSALLFGLLMVCVLIFRRVPQRMVQRLSFYMGLILLLMFVTTNTFAIMQHYDHTHCQQAVIMPDAVSCYNSPVARGRAVCTLHTGTLVTITDTYGKDWLEVRLPDTRQLWLHRQSLTRVAE